MKLWGEEEGVWEAVGVRVPADELDVSVWDPTTSPVGVVKLPPDAVNVGNAEELDLVVLVPGESCPSGFNGEWVVDKLFEEASFPRVALEEVEGVCELPEELGVREVDWIVDNERLELDDEDTEVDDSEGVSVLV